MPHGHDSIGLAVVYFCHDGRGKFVMAKRSQHARDERGKWDIGGGAVEFGESVLQTLEQEIAQEYSTTVIEHEFLGYRDVHREHDGAATHWVTLDFRVLVEPSTVAIGEPEKFDEIGWFTFESMPSDVHSQLPHFLNTYKNRL